MTNYGLVMVITFITLYIIQKYLLKKDFKTEKDMFFTNLCLSLVISTIYYIVENRNTMISNGEKIHTKSFDEI